MTDPRRTPRSTRVRWAVLLALMGAAACAPAPPADTTEEARAGIQATNARFMEAVEAKDAAAIAALYTDDARILPPGSAPVEGRQAIEQFFGGILQGIGRLQLDTVEIEAHGDTAHEQEALTFFDASGAQIDEGKAIVIWKRVGEEWRLHRDIFNSNVPPAAAPAPSEGEPAEDAAPPPPG